MRFQRGLLTALLCLGFLAGSSLTGAAVTAPDRVLQPIENSRMTLIPGNMYGFAKPEYDQGRADAGMLMNSVILSFRLSPAQEAARTQMLADVHNPASPLFHKWLTPELYAQQFGLTQNDVNRIVAWLQSVGFANVQVNRSRTEVSFSGTVAQVEGTFQTQIHHYLVKGETHYANATNPSVPAALGGVVLSIRHLNDFRAHAASHVQPNLVTYKPHATASDNTHALAAGDVAVIYDINPLYTAGFTGTGQSIAVIGRTTIDLSDIDQFRAAFGLSFNEPTQTLVPNTGVGVREPVAGDLGETDLDLEWTGAVAQTSTIKYVYVGNAAPNDVFDAFTYTIDQNLAPVISVSYGLCELGLGTALETTFGGQAMQANLQGQTIVAAAGDAGAADCDGGTNLAQCGLAVDVPAALPNVTGAGGSEFFGDPDGASAYWSATNSSTLVSALSYIPEIAWNDTATSTQLEASGGGASVWGPTGPSNLAAKPSWQVGLGVPADGARDVPDIAMNASANHDPYLFCTAQSCATAGSFMAVGGTSVSAPVFAGIMALVNQYTGSTAGQGNANVTLYALAALTPTAFHDITAGDNIVPCLVTTADTGCNGTINTQSSFGFLAGPGYDQVTGLGTIDANVLVTNWAAAQVVTPDFTIAANPTSVTLSAPGASGSTSLLLTEINAFSGTVNLTCAGPGGATVTCSLSPTAVTLDAVSATTGASTLTVTADPASIGGTFAVVVTATSGSVTHMLTVNVVVPAPDFTITANPTTVTLSKGTAQSGSSVLTFAGVNTFTGTVNLSVACTLPAGVELTCAIDPSASVPGTATVSFSTIAAHLKVAKGVKIASNRGTSGNPLGGLPWLPLAAVALMGAGFSFRKRRLLSAQVVVLLLIAVLLLGFAACGGSSTAVTPPAVSVAVTPTTPTGVVSSGAAVQFTATVMNSTDTSVTWSESGTAGGVLSTSGLYTPPATLTAPAMQTVTATSVADSTKSGSVSFTVNPVEPGTTVGNWTATVTATSTTGITHTAVVTVSVTP